MLLRLVALAVTIPTLLYPVSLLADSSLAIPYFPQEEVQISIDGRLDDAIWRKTTPYDNFSIVTPDIGGPGRYRTEVRYFYTDRGFYVGMWNEQPPDTLLPRLSSRDGFMSRDGMQVTLDTSGEGLYGYWFSVYLGGSIGDGIVLPERRFRSNWDGAWYGNAAETEDGWSAELFIPWAILNMPKSQSSTRSMGVYVSRALGELNERWSDPYLPSSQPRFLSALNRFELKNINPGQEYNFFPYSSGSVDNIRNETDFRAGLDVFWRPSSYLQLSGTINPDFGQVEADDVVVNLTAFETFFPEKRLFFLENQEIFDTTSRNASDGTLLNTRRIGTAVAARNGGPDFTEDLDYDSHDTGQPVDLIGALKATGQRGPLRYGVMAAVEDDTRVSVTGGTETSVETAGRDFGVVRLLYENTDSGGRRALGWMGTVADHPDRRAVTQGIDAHLLTGNGKLTADGQLFFSDVEGVHGFGALGEFEYVPKSGVEHELEFDYFDEDLNLNDLGFLPRTERFSARYRYRLRQTDLSDYRQRDTSIGVRETRNLDRIKTGGGWFVGRQWLRQDNSQVSLNLNYIPVYHDDRNSRGNGTYRRDDTWQVNVGWNSDWAKPYTVSLSASYQQEPEGGDYLGFGAELIYRPTDRYTARIRARYFKRDAWLIHAGDRNFATYSTEQWQPRFIFDTFFTARQQLRIEVQWVGIKARDDRYWEIPVDGRSLREVARPTWDTTDGFAISNVTLQARYRWEIAPLSDLFVVYNRGGSLSTASNDDSFGSLLGDTISDPQNEFLVVKLRYRFGPG